ncbi:universal minicircle sequence binding protein [Lasius niger]|uniref:Universal minicircle sequence binding protein n=1 Tax=Lasius niger TaxID=67767 RepID=A0A0J7KHK6_LASNI|nr:universal minicircle sequence binding protein [Lasius niger]
MIRKLKERFIQYKCMKNEMKGKSKPLKTEEKKECSKQEGKMAIVKACFNCGERNHISKDCPDKDKRISVSSATNTIILHQSVPLSIRKSLLRRTRCFNGHKGSNLRK